MKRFGSTYADTMKTLGYGMWSIDEFPCTLVDSQPTSPSNITAWRNVVDLVEGLSQGGAEGITFNCDQGQSKSKGALRTVKSNTETLFSNSTPFDWNTLSATKLWAEEAYTLCSDVCVQGTSLGNKATHTNAFMQHPARLAFAPDAPSAAKPIQNFLQSRYLPLINGWGKVGGVNHPNTNGYGTYGLTTEQIRRLASLQTYAARAWVRSDNPYAGLRIGVRWTDRTDKKTGWNGPDRATLARRIARALAGSYRTAGTALGACDPTGAGKSKLCQPVANGARFTETWAMFRLWGNTACSPPSNDNFAGAITLGNSGSVDGTIACATVEQDKGEWTAGGDITKSVWYSWTAPTDDTYDFWAWEKAAQPSNDLQTFVYTGDGLGNLTRVSTFSEWAYGSGFTASKGETYYIEVANSTTHLNSSDPDATDFTLYWGVPSL